MIERLEGQLLEVGPEHVLITIGGIGIRASVPRTVADRLSAGSHAVILTRLLVRDGEPQLYGFLTVDERAAFDALVSVSGVGPRIGLGVLSYMDPGRLAGEIERGSPAHLLTVPGVGRKLAARILLELKGKIQIARAEASGAERAEASDGSDLALEATRALTALGYQQGAAREAVRLALASHPQAPPLDQLIREALIGLARTRG